MQKPLIKIYRNVLENTKCKKTSAQPYQSVVYWAVTADIIFNYLNTLILYYYKVNPITTYAISACGLNITEPESCEE